MIIFYEGLPRSGKSYSALKDFIIPCLQKGRAVSAYIDGLDHQKIADVAGISYEDCLRLLKPLTRDQVPQFYKHVANDDFVVLDEAQNFFRQEGRKALPTELSNFIAEHGHFGLDILLMGQVFNDVHSDWRKRCAQRNYYFKMEAAGKPDHYQETVYKAVPSTKGHGVEFAKVSQSGLKGIPYDSKYFGCYASHDEKTDNKETLDDPRANIWNTPFVKRWLPLYGVIFVCALGFIIYEFTGGLASSAKQKVAKHETAQHAQPVNHTAQVLASSPAPKVAPVPEPKKLDDQQKSFVDNDAPLVPDDPLDIVDNYSHNYRIRLTGSAKMGDKTAGWIEWRNESYGVIERLTFDDLAAMGWTVLANQNNTLAIVQKYHRRYIATAWPLPDPQGQLTTKQVDDLKPTLTTPITPTVTAAK